MGSILHLPSWCDSKVYEHPDQLIAEAQEKLAGVDFDTMVGGSQSAALAIPLLSRAMGKHMVIVRVPRRYGKNDAEGDLGSRWLFVDDHIESGQTFAQIQQVIRDLEFREQSSQRSLGWHVEDPVFRTELVGAYEYQPHDHGGAAIYTPASTGKLRINDPWSRYSYAA
jgi:hypothetical protein